MRSSPPTQRHPGRAAALRAQLQAVPNHLLERSRVLSRLGVAQRALRHGGGGACFWRQTAARPTASGPSKQLPAAAPRHDDATSSGVIIRFVRRIVAGPAFTGTSRYVGQQICVRVNGIPFGRALGPRSHAHAARTPMYGWINKRSVAHGCPPSGVPGAGRKRLGSRLGPAAYYRHRPYLPRPARLGSAECRGR